MITKQIFGIRYINNMILAGEGTKNIIDTICSDVYEDKNAAQERVDELTELAELSSFNPNEEDKWTIVPITLHLKE